MQLIQVGRVGGGYQAWVDDLDYELASQYRWRKLTGQSGLVYAQRRWFEGEIQRGQLMHTLITGWPYVDHEDHNGLNCQRYNMREATQHQNGANSRARTDGTSRFKGVYRVGVSWRACIRSHRQRTYLGSFVVEEDAARAYDAKALELFGELPVRMSL